MTYHLLAVATINRPFDIVIAPLQPSQAVALFFAFGILFLQYRRGEDALCSYLHSLVVCKPIVLCSTNGIIRQEIEVQVFSLAEASLVVFQI